MNIRLVLAGAALGALTAAAAAAQTYAPPGPDYTGPYGPPATYGPPPDQTYPSDYPPPSDYGPPPDQAYPPPGAEAYGAPPGYGYPPPDVAPVYIPGRRYYWEYPGDTSPGAQYSVRLHSYVNPHSGVTAPPNPNNVSDQVPSHGFDFDGVPPELPY